MRFVSVSVALALVIAAGVASATVVYGHAEYDHSHPGDGEVLSTPPTEVEVHFTEGLDPLGENSLNVLGPGNVDVDNNDLVIGPDELTITLQGGLSDGTYTVEWVTTSEDGDTEEGTFQFFIQQAVGGIGMDLTSGGTSGPGWNAGVLAGVAGALVIIAASIASGSLYLAKRR
jgi:copper transport protein